MWNETVQIEGPYHFENVLNRLSLDPLQKIDWQKQALSIPLWINNEPMVVEVSNSGTVQNPQFIVSGKHEAHKELAIRRVSQILQWDVSLAEIHEHFISTDLRPIFENHFGTPLVLDFDPYSCLIKCIIHQQLNLSFAFKLTERFVKTFGFEKDGVWFYPQPDKVAALQVEDLRELQFSGRKAEYTIGVSQAIVNGELDLDKLRDKAETEIFAELIKLKGVGPWTIQNLLMFGYGKPNLFPTADIGLQNALKKLYNLESKPTIEQMEQYKQTWQPYQTYASLYLWRSIE